MMCRGTGVIIMKRPAWHPWAPRCTYIAVNQAWALETHRQSSTPGSATRCALEWTLKVWPWQGWVSLAPNPRESHRHKGRIIYSIGLWNTSIWPSLLQGLLTPASASLILCLCALWFLCRGHPSGQASIPYLLKTRPVFPKEATAQRLMYKDRDHESICNDKQL